MLTKKQQNISNFSYFRSQNNLTVPLRPIIVIALLIQWHLETFFYIKLWWIKRFTGNDVPDRKHKKQVQL